MAKSPRRFFLIKPALLTVPLNFPERQPEPDLSALKQQIVEFGILEPLVVRKLDNGFFRVLGGRRRLEAAWELQDEGYDTLVRTIPCYVVESNDSVTDLRIFTILNTPSPFGHGEMERVTTLLEEATAPSRRRRK